MDQSSTSQKSDDGPIVDSSDKQILFEHQDVLFSALRERKMRFALVWKDWSSRYIKILSDKTLHYARPHKKNRIPKHHILRLDKIEVTLMSNATTGDGTGPDKGLIVKCQTYDYIETYFRCIFTASDLAKFLSILKEVAFEHNIDTLPEMDLTVNAAKSSYLFRSKASVMRRAITQAMDKYDRRSKKERIIAKRGTMKYLPVLGSNDLIHGSWWFVFGSIGVLITSIVMVYNKYFLVFNDDDSDLSKANFVASWVLLCFSGVFSTLGSLAFVRAFHEDPPMKPLFTWYHFQSDELLASWLFFLSTVPFFPYVLIFLADSGYHSLLYLIALAFVIIILLGTLLFVRACYPSDRTHRDILLPMSRYMCCCFSDEWREHHLMNDWLGGSWCFLWGCQFATFATAILFIVSISDNNGLQMFMYGTSLLENICFLIGSAYFVAGSYPEGFHALGESTSPNAKSTDLEQGADYSEKSTIVNPVAGLSGQMKAQKLPTEELEDENVAIEKTLHDFKSVDRSSLYSQ